MAVLAIMFTGRSAATGRGDAPFNHFNSLSIIIVSQIDQNLS
jgi:hypothetical protein